MVFTQVNSTRIHSQLYAIITSINFNVSYRRKIWKTGDPCEAKVCIRYHQYKRILLYALTTYFSRVPRIFPILSVLRITALPPKLDLICVTLYTTLFLNRILTSAGIQWESIILKRATSRLSLIFASMYAGVLLDQVLELPRNRNPPGCRRAQ